MKKITADRKEEHDEFLLAKKDDQDAVELLNKAKDALTAFYKKNGIKVLMQAEPAFEVSEDQAAYLHPLRVSNHMSPYSHRIGSER